MGHAASQCRARGSLTGPLISQAALPRSTPPKSVGCAQPALTPHSLPPNPQENLEDRIEDLFGDDDDLGDDDGDDQGGDDGDDK